MNDFKAGQTDTAEFVLRANDNLVVDEEQSMNVREAFSLAFCLTLLILFLAGCGSPPVTPEPTSAPPPPPAAPVTTNPSANWQLYVTGMLVGDAAAPLVEQLALPEPTAGRQWLLLKLTLENISDAWLALPAGGISGGLLDSDGSELALTGLDFAPYTRLPDGEDIALAPRFQAAGLAWVEILPNHTPTEVWLDVEGTQTGQTPESVNVNLTESSQPPPLFNAIQLPISPPGTVFDFPNDLRATVTSVQLEPAAGDQFRVRVDLDLENTGGTALALAGDQFAQIWGTDKGGRYFCCLAVEAGQGGDFGPDKKLAPGQLAQGYLATQPFTSETGTTPEALVILTLHGRTNTVTEIFLARVQTGDGGPVSTVPAPASLLATNLALAEANGIAAVGNVAYLTDSAGLHLLDIANPTAPQEIDFYPAEGAPGVVVDGPIVYLSSGGQLHLIDISNPAAPQLVGLYPLPPYGGSYLAVSSHTLYLSAGQEGFISLDVSNPAEIRELGRVAGDTSKIAVLGQTVYAVDGVDTLRIFDVADPAQPHLLGAFRPGDVITDLVVVPSPADPSIPLAYLGTLGRGVRLVDVSNPAGPRQIGAYPSKGSAYSLALAGDRLYVANGWAASGLSVVDITDPAVPVEVSFIPAAREWDSVVDLAVAPVPGGVNVYIANRFEGLLVYSDIPAAISPGGEPAVAQELRYNQERDLLTFFPLPHEEGYIRTLAIDLADRVWVAAALNLYLLDPASSAPTWTNVTSATGGPTGVEALLIDDRGQVWAGSGSGVSVFNGQSWTTYAAADGLSDDWVHALALDAVGRLWAGTERGLNQFDGEVWSAIAAAPAPVLALAIDSVGRVWAGSASGVSVFDGSTWTAYPTAGDFALMYVNAITSDADGNMWVASGACFLAPGDCTNTGLSKFDGQNWANYLQTYFRDYSRSGPVFAVNFDRDGYGWVGLNSRFMRFDPQTLPAGAQDDDPAWTIYPGFIGQGGQVHAIAFDRAGNVWLGGSNGVARLNEQ